MSIPMENFYRQLLTCPEVPDPLFQGWVAVTHASLEQLQSLDVGWDSWTVAASAN